MIRRLSLGLAITVIVLGVILMALSILDIYEGSELSFPIDITNTLLIVIVSIFVAYIAARIFSDTGSMQILLLGGGVLAFGASSWFRAWMVDLDGNVIITVQDSAVLIASFLHLSSAALWFIKRKILVIKLKHRLVIAILYYLLILVIILLIALLTLRDVTPVFYIPGEGTTALQEMVRGIAAIFYVLASFMIISIYLNSRIDNYYWYSTGLFLFGFGVFFVSQGPLVSMIAWLGRIAHYIGSIYFLVFIINAYSSMRNK